MPGLLDHRGNPLPASRPEAPTSTRPAPMVPIRGRYDAAQTTDDNRRHWSNADHLSAKSANDPTVRRTLRNRSRYETANNSYAAGMVSTLAYDLVGTGPRLQLLTTDDDLNRDVEAAFARWSAAVKLASKLRTMRRARAVDGEAFGLLGTNDRIPGPVKLDFRPVEADMISTPSVLPFPRWAVDGIVLDGSDNPIEYHLLKEHPGDTAGRATFGEYDRIPAPLVAHWFKVDRPQQYRGVPELTPALELFAQLRRYTLAVLAAAETAADFAAVLYSELPPDDDDVASGEPFEALEIEKRAMMTLPKGWKMGQFRAEQPVATYEMFKREILNEIARCLNVPYNVAAGNSSGYNYSSGRLDHQVYFRALEVDRADLESIALDPILGAWLEEAALTLRRFPRSLVGLENWPHQWLWPGLGHIDPEKEANATKTRLETFTTTFSSECQRAGVDAETMVRTISADVKLFARYGLPSPYGAKSPTSTTAPGPTTDGASSDGAPDANATGLPAGILPSLNGRNGNH